MEILSNLSGFRGRAGLAEFWQTLLLLGAIFYGLSTLASFVMPNWFAHLLPLETAPRAATIQLFSTLTALLPVIIPLLFVLIRRLHDRGWPGWIIIVPMIALFPVLRTVIKVQAMVEVGLFQMIFAAISMVILLWSFVEIALMPGCKNQQH